MEGTNRLTRRAKLNRQWQTFVRGFSRVLTEQLRVSHSLLAPLKLLMISVDISALMTDAGAYGKLFDLELLLQPLMASNLKGHIQELVTCYPR